MNKEALERHNVISNFLDIDELNTTKAYKEFKKCVENNLNYWSPDYLNHEKTVRKHVNSKIKESLEPHLRETFLMKKVGNKWKYNNRNFRLLVESNIYQRGLSFYGGKRYLDLGNDGKKFIIKYKATKYAEEKSSHIMPFDVSFYIFLLDKDISDGKWIIAPSVHSNSTMSVPSSVYKYAAVADNFIDAHDNAYSNIHEMIIDSFNNFGDVI